MKTYVTCVVNERYLPGLYALALGLEKHKAKYPLLVLVPEDKKTLALHLTSNGYAVKTIPNIACADTMQNWYWNFTFFKLAAASLVEYEKVVLLDTDLLLLGNIDCLFERPHLSGAMTGRVSYPWLRSFNSGVLVLEPNAAYFQRLVFLIPETIKRCRSKNQFVGDQDVFQASMPDWYDRPELHLDEKYNESPGKCIKDYYKAFPKDNILVVHYAGPKKPWDYSLIHFWGVYLFKYFFSGNLRGGRYLKEYYFLTKRFLRSWNKKEIRRKGKR